MPVADLEIAFRPTAGAAYQIDLRYRPPSSATDAHLLESPCTIEFDHQALLTNALDAQTYGALLTRQLFADPRLREAFGRVRAAAAAANVPLRVTLRLPQTAGVLHQMIWERLCDPGDDEPLFASQRALLSRTIDTADIAPLNPRQDGVLTALALISSPTDLSEYGLEPIASSQEIARIRAAVDGLPLTVVARATDGRPATLVRLLDALRTEPDILYVLCHGAIRNGVPYLWLEREDGTSDCVNGVELARRLGRLARRPLLVVLMTCASAGQPHDDWGTVGIGPHLAAAGVAAVVAIHGTITLGAAAILVPFFFAELLRHGLVDRAMAAAREALLGQPDWSAPVLYLRLRDGRLFAPEVLARPRCPYPGLAPFCSDDAEVFHGRDTEIAELLRRVEHQRQVLLIGPSGSGKSSLLAAGLLPKLAGSSLFPPGTWLTRQMRPGERPATTLRELLGAASGDLARAIATLLQAYVPARRLLLVVDQLEELFVLPKPAEREAFIDQLQALQADASCTIVLALRADFFPDLMASRLWDAYATHRVELVPLRDGALRAAIEQPATTMEVRVEPGLSERLLADAAGEPGSLPLLQETMRQLWQAMEGRRLTLAAYTTLGGDGRTGLGTATVTRADATLQGLPEAQRALARRVFLRLVQFGEGRSDTRRRQPIEALRAADDPEGQLDAAIQTLTSGRLLTLDDEPGRGRTVDIAHESLLSIWPTLRAWLSERRDAELTRRRLEAKASEWTRLGQGRAGQLDEIELAEAEGWLHAPDAAELGVSTTLLALIHTSRETIAEAERLARETQEREIERLRAQADERAATNRRLRRFALALTALLALALPALGAAVYFGIDANTQRRDAVRSASEAATSQAQAQANEQTAQANAGLAERSRATAAAALEQVTEAQLLRAARANGLNDLDISLLLSVEAVERDPESLSSRGSLLAALSQVPFLQT